MKKQVKKDHYLNLRYNNLERFISYWYQFKTVVENDPSEVLEIGVGPGVVSSFLSKMGISVTTVDIDPELDPDYVADITELPMKDNSYDYVCAYEVLEHMPFDRFEKALQEMKRVSKNYVVFSIPDAQPSFTFTVRLKNFAKSLMINLPFYPQKHKFDGQHYWELNKKGYSFRRVLKIIKKLDLRLEDHYRVKEKPYHHFFILKKCYGA